MSSMAPTIIINPDGQVSMVIGSAGGAKITTAIANSIILHYYMKSNLTLEEIFWSKRLHHQLLPNIVSFEPDFDQHIIDGLAALNHTMDKIKTSIGFGALVGVLKVGEAVSAAYDPRRGGSTAVFSGTKPS